MNGCVATDPFEGEKDGLFILVAQLWLAGAGVAGKNYV
jgi:hypothetical protein